MTVYENVAPDGGLALQASSLPVPMTRTIAVEDHRNAAERFRALALPHLDDVYTLARYLLRNPADAEDAAQECFLRAFRHFETFRGGPIKPWLLAILRNVCRVEYARRNALAGVQSESMEAAEQCAEGLWADAE